MKKLFSLILFLLLASTAYSAEQPAHIGSFKVVYGQGDRLLYWDDTNYRVYHPNLSGLSLSAGTLSLSATGVGAGSYANVTVDTDGRVTTGSTSESVGTGGTGITSYSIGDMLYASASNVLSRLADVSAGSYLRSGGVTTAPLWSTLKIPNSAVKGDLLVADNTNNISVITAVGTGQVLTSAGVTTVPVYSATPTVTSITASNHSSNVADPADAGIVRLGNAETIAWEASPASTDVTITVNTSEQIVGSTSFVGTTSILAPFFSQNSGDPADAGNYRLPNAGTVAWEASPAGTDVTLTANTSEVIVASTSLQATTSMISPVFVTTNADPADAAEFRLGNAERLAWEANPTGTDLTVGFNSNNVFSASAPIDATTGYRIGNAAATGTILRGNGTNFVPSTTTYPDTVTANQVLFATATNVVGQDSDFTFATDTATITKVSSGTVISTGVVRLKNYTVATLPAGTQGDTAFVTDALAPAFLTAVVGGGAIVTPVFYDGTNWVSY